MRILVLSDIHANLVALESVLGAANGKYDTIWCLGDIVGYGPRPNECVELIRDRASACVIGNHDWAALDRPGVNVDDFNPHARFAVLWTREQLTEENRAFLDALADKPLRPMPELSLLITHASPREPVWEYILAPSTALENFMEFDEEICLVGHTHKPAIYAWQHLAGSSNGAQQVLSQSAAERVAHQQSIAFAAEAGTSAEAGQGETGNGVSVALMDGEEPGTNGHVVCVSALLPQPNSSTMLRSNYPTRLIVNPGSVGQPRDNDARASYGILDTEKGSWRYERVSYPIELTQGQMREARLPRRLIDRLSFGW